MLRIRRLQMLKVCIVTIIVAIIIIAVHMWTTNSFAYEPPRFPGLTYKSSDDTWLRIKFYAGGNTITKEITIRDDDYSAFDTSDGCTVPRLDDSAIPSDVTCKRPVPVKGSCRIANKIFHNDPVPNCGHQKSYDICRLKNYADTYLVDCTNRFCSKNISLGTIRPLSGSMRWKAIPNVASLESEILKVISKDEPGGNFGFCFLKCKALHERTIASQLLLLPKNFSQIRCKEGDSCRESININVIWLDSTSHSHFYRSMPKSVGAFRRIKSNKDAYVFNYNLMQSLAGGTYTNMVAFTAGKILTRHAILDTKQPIGDIFKLFHQQGHHVTWIDDLCWSWSIVKCACGIPKFLGIVPKDTHAETWKQVKEMLAWKGVDQIDISLANCQIMKDNKMTDPFYDETNKIAICYNGRYQTDYILSSLELLHTQLNSVKRPFLNFVDLNLGHEASGRRIQTLDERFAKYLTFLSQHRNTFTLIFGDHGNKYGEYVKDTKESKIEMAHTVLFAMASSDLQDKLGRDKMNALDINQHRLVNIMDLRQTILSLVPGNLESKGKSPKIDRTDTHVNGLFHLISPKRSCHSMGIPLEAAKCICDDGRVPSLARNDTRVVVMAEFALGVINNKIQQQFLAANGNEGAGFGACRRLVGMWISGVQETTTDGKTITEMNIHVPADSNMAHSEAVFAVVLLISSPPHDEATTIELGHYERISTYAIYDKCRDTGVDGDLCVCSTSQETQVNRKKNLYYWHQAPHVVFGHPTTVISLNDCLFIYERRTLYGLVIETSCDCNNLVFQLKVVIKNHVNVVYSKLLPISTTVRSGTMLFVAAFHQFDPMHKWNLDYDIQFMELP